MVESGVPWRYRYSALEGGVNTGRGWEHYMDSAGAPVGEYPKWYMEQSDAIHALPLLSYYEICQSLGTYPSICDGNIDHESVTDYQHVNDSTLMAAYYANFKLLMQKSALFGKQVLIDVEADFLGFMELRAKAAGSASAAGVSASVASSGMPELAGIPDTVQGWAWALLRLRDLYGPNALLGIHASHFANGNSVATNRDPTMDAIADADAIAVFLNSVGIAANPYGSTWDSVVIEIDTRDAGWYEAMGLNSVWETHWWDRANVTYPNFDRYLAWASRLHERTARPLVLLQVPVGNQYYLTTNNTPGHYQDNRAEWFITHPDRVFAAGIVAVLFGPGNGRDVRQTTFEDAEADGITNNGGLPTTDLEGGCDACNTHVSQFADDDGGFLRTFVGLYYNPPPAPAPGSFRPLPPIRILDTRDGTGGVRGKLGPGQTLELHVAGLNGVDASASAAVINLTVDGATAPSYLTIYPSGQPTPMVSNLNFQPGQVVANLTHVAIGAGGAVSVYNAQGWVDVVLDLNGFFTLGGALGSGLFRALPPTRLLDTRLSGLRLGPGQTIDLRVGGAGSVPYPGAAATVLNLTATGANQGSYLTLFPTGQSRPLASNVNFPAGRDVPNRAIAKLGSGGKVSIYNAVGWVDVVVDLGGWFTDSSNPGAVGGLYHPQRPSRVLDTRLQGPALGEGSVRNLPLGLGGAAVVLNVTSVNPSSGSFITVYPSDGSMPLASDLNLVVGQDIPNLVEVKLGSDGGVKLYNALGQTQMVADLQGWYG
jgi:hypothetical protein